MGMAIVCMVNSTEYADNSTDFEGAEKMNWSPEQQVTDISPFIEHFLGLHLLCFQRWLVVYASDRLPR